MEEKNNICSEGAVWQLIKRFEKRYNVEAMLRSGRSRVSQESIDEVATITSSL